MKKNKSKKSDKYTEISIPIGYLDSVNEGGDEDLDVSVRQYIRMEGSSTDHPIELNAWEARKLARALLEAADRLDGGK